VISSEYIPQDKLVHFERMWELIELAYNRVIELLSDTSSLPYIPNIYPMPIMIMRTSTIHARMVRVLFYSVVYPNKNNFEKFAIYPTLTLIERLPSYLTGVIGHEIAHIILVTYGIVCTW
jgi:Zn-dependent protease with chaperone function